MLEQLVEGGKYLVGGPAGQDQRAPGHTQADAERGFGRAPPADVADKGVHPAVRRLDHVVEIPAQQHVLAAGPAARRYAQPGVSQQRRREQAALKPGILLGVDLRRVQLPLCFLRTPAFHRVPDHPVQHVPGDVAFDQVVLCSGPDRLFSQVLVGIAGQHDDGRFRLDLEQLPEPVQALRIRQAQVEKDAGRAGHQLPGLTE